MTENILLCDFTRRGRDAAAQALADLGTAHDRHELKLREARVIARDADGDVEVPADVDHTGTAPGFAVGGLVGALVGLLGGPVGALIGFGAGGLLGGSQDARRAATANAALEELTDEVPPGSTVLVAEVGETSPEAADRILGPGVHRYDAKRLRRELEAALSAPDADGNAHGQDDGFGQ
ncbi:DUF1269 domain-containing protein [Streptomyces boncukensis]|uniref:DUF1269 domain-containing protein n=1 Tax=Streptomyces boncukensis TaxID=2711219 RepID=A0A6G4X4A1_9ACTN|nr:DUF1269 domain-containing protein [Streptomyces boncukensis]NGO72218.1 DUF1269 domain-containing protein [Streptomyces boncukensis]